MSIQEVATSLQTINKNNYSQWLQENPGKVMCNFDILSSAFGKIARECLTIDDVIKYRDECRAKYKVSTGMNGFGLHASACSQIIDKYNKNSDEH